ncbi:hypothetical protein POTOM_036738 [Populus tomentosa]|uniref:DUF2470 domain-containing protein n=1 Tax=Populus tomentosa TaxID=118781 RepID=A0A8X7Z3G3_POPTO|nr:hypothetical protein POTOM_036738 [Populus tomentosa]
MKGSKTTILTLAEKCKNILASNWQAQLNTIKADAKGSKGGIYSSKVKYILKKGKPYLWVNEKDMHNVNTIIDDRASLAIASPFPGPLANLFKSMQKLPARIAITGNVVPLKEEKEIWLAFSDLRKLQDLGVPTTREFSLIGEQSIDAKSESIMCTVQLVAESLKEVMLSEQRQINEAPYTVSGVLSSSNLITTSRSENLKELLDGVEEYGVYRFNLSSCMFIDGHGRTHEVDMEAIEASKVDPLVVSPAAFLSAKLIDGINRSESRRRALVLFCFVYLNADARDAFMLAVDRKGFDVLAKVPSSRSKDGTSEYVWKQFRFPFKEEELDVETFCQQLVKMEEEAVKKVSGYSGLT